MQRTTHKVHNAAVHAVSVGLGVIARPTVELFLCANVTGGANAGSNLMSNAMNEIRRKSISVAHGNEIYAVMAKVHSVIAKAAACSVVLVVPANGELLVDRRHF